MTFKELGIQNKDVLQILFSNKSRQKEVTETINDYFYQIIIHHEGDDFDFQVATLSSYPISYLINQYKIYFNIPNTINISAYFNDFLLDQNKTLDDYYLESGDIIELKY